jgi:hypothetical protein
MFHSIYRGCHIYRNTKGGHALPWEAYVDGRGFVYADTLTGIRELIRERSDGRRGDA